MITDGWILPDRHFHFDARFDVRGCLLAFHSFLSNHRMGAQMFPEYIFSLCKEKGVNMRLVLAMMQTGTGLLKRKRYPSRVVMKHAVKQPDRSVCPPQFDAQVRACVDFMRENFHNANTRDPLHVNDTVVLPKTRLSYVLFRYLGEAGQKGYPDTGAFLYVRYFNQLQRFYPSMG